MPFDIIIGRDEEDAKLLGNKGVVLIGKSYVRMGRTTSLSNPLFLDIARGHVIYIVGKRGSGKSYTMGAIAEGIMDLPADLKRTLQ